MIDKAIKGDQSAIDYLHVQKVDIVIDQPLASMWNTICADYHYHAVNFEVADQLCLHHLRRTSKMALPETTTKKHSPAFSKKS